MTTILDATTRANVRAATTQPTQLTAAVAPWGGGNVELEHRTSADVLLTTVTHGPWTINTETDPYQAQVGAYVSESKVASGTAAYVIAAVPAGAEILRQPVTMAAAISGTSGRTSLVPQSGATGLVVRASAGLPTSAIPSHISSAAAGEWTSISSNTLSDVAFNYTGWGVSGFATTLQSVMNPWSGAAYDYVRNRLLVKGGGHNDYDGNEVYVFNLSTALWSRLDNPSPYDEDAFSGGAANPNGWNGVYTDNGPQPIHTYDVLCINPTTGKMYELGKSGSTCLTQIRELNPAIATQQTPGDTKSWWAYRATISWPDGHSGTSAWMSDEAKFVIGYQDGGTFINFRTYDPATDTVSAQIDAVVGGDYSGDMALAYSASRRLAVVHRGSNSLVLLSRATNTVSLQTVTGATLPVRCGLEYDTVRDVFWAYTDEGADRRVLYSINPSTWVATTVSPAGASIGSVALDYRGIYGRFAYCEDFDVLLAVNSVTGGVYIYKPTGWTAP